MVAPPTSRHPWSPRENWHITLAFHGECSASAVEELIANLPVVAQQTPPFELALAGSGVFRNDAYWIGVHDPSQALPPLAALLRQSYATANQHAHNRFHITVARAGRRGHDRGKGSAMDRAVAALSVYRGPTWTVESITLFQSELGAGFEGHPRYTVLAEAQLGPRPYIPTGGTVQ